MTTAHVHSLSMTERMPVYHIEVAQPAMGGKAYLLNDKGLFVLERGPGTMITMACTHAGAGSVEFIDGIPDDNGFFPDTDMMQPDPLDYASPDDFAAAVEKYGKRNGRVFYRATPVVMGSWMLNAGCHNGLTVRAMGGHQAVPAVATIVWMPHRRAATP